MEINGRSQRSGDNSTNIQAGQITINTGLTISHVKEIANELIAASFAELAGLARETAEKRAREITNQFIQELAEKHPAGMQAAEDPDFQHSLFTVQKEFARCGDKELGDILVDLLVDRTKQKDRSLLQIVLNESLSVAPKLNAQQLDILTCCFHVVYVFRGDIGNIAMFSDYLENVILVFSDSINSKPSNYKHIEFVGCTEIREGKRDIINVITENYRAFFSKGYQRDAIKAIEEREPNIIDVHIPCFHDFALLQPGGINDNVTKQMCADKGISEESANQLIQLNAQYVMNQQEAREFLEKICPRFPKFLDDAANTQFNSMELTSVGIAIAHAHSRKKIGFDADLSIWI